MSESPETEVEKPTPMSAEPDSATVETLDDGASAQHSQSKSIKHRRGTVVSAKMQGTIIVLVERRVKHRRYKKYVNVRQRYAVDDKLSCSEGDIVVIRETRPLSKTKRWEVARKVTHHG